VSWKVRIPRPISRQIGVAGLSRNAIIRLLVWVRRELATRTDHYHHNRAPTRPNCFLMHKHLVDGTTVHHCTFIVSDAVPGEVTVKDFEDQPSV